MALTPQASRRTLLGAGVLLLWLPGVAPAAGVQAEARDVGSFRALSLSTAARVIVRQGERPSVEVRGEADVLPLIDTRVEDGTLVVEDAGRYTSSSAEVRITVSLLTAMATAGSVAVAAHGLKLRSLRLAMGGSSAVSLRNAVIGRLNVAMGGSSALKASGSADVLSCVLGGSAAVQASQLAAKDVSVSGGGSAQAVVWAADSLSLRLGGSAGVSHYGAARPSQTIGGSARVTYLGPAPSAR